MQPAALLAGLVGAALLLAAGLKATDRTSTAVAAGTFGIDGRAARWVWAPLAAIEAVLGAGLLLGDGAAAVCAAPLLAVFAVAQFAAVARGRAGAPCGCFGARGVISRWSAARSA